MGSVELSEVLTGGALVVGDLEANTHYSSIAQDIV